MVKISVSVLGADDKIKALKQLNQTDADYLHLDLMDGKFVPFKTPNFNEVNKILLNSHKKLEIHLMVEDPHKYIEDYALLDTEYITIHSEIKHPARYLKQIKDYGIKAGLAVNPQTPISIIEPYLEELDLVVIMSVEPGLPGQTFMPEVLTKIKELKQMTTRNILIAVDGGINDQNCLLIEEQGADMLCSGSYITNSDDYQSSINKLRG